MPQRKFAKEAVFVCEDVSSIEFRDGLFYLTDDFGDFQIRRAMRPSTFLKCVRGAYALAEKWEGGATGAKICELPRH